MSEAPVARGQGAHPVEHEPIPPDPANDVAYGLRLDGDLPAAVETPSGLVAAPDPREPLPPVTPESSDTDAPSLAGHTEDSSPGSRYQADTDTRRPDTLPYRDPFVPSTAPWKRLVAYDVVERDFSLAVRDPSLHPIPLHDVVHAAAPAGGGEEQFFGDLVVDLRAGQPVRIPSVGPGARVVHARLGVGADDVDFELLRDGADNWFVRANTSGRARLVFELTIPRAVFGGPVDPGIDAWQAGWAPVPPNVQRDVDVVAAKIGVPRQTRRATLDALVAYFRDFTDSPDLPTAEHGVYLALALSQKGVCRHRAYAFMVTASGLGIRTRAVMNEAHAWVEVWDGRLWKRIDLGGAGNLLAETTPPTTPYAPPPDPFAWPAGARRGDDLARTARSSVNGAAGADPAEGLASGGTEGTRTSPAASAATTTPAADPDRAPSSITLNASEHAATRGEPFHVEGTMTADGAPCPHVLVVISGRDRKTLSVFPLGDLVTHEHGAFAGPVLVPKSLAVGPYDVIASSSGDTRCGPGASK